MRERHVWVFFYGSFINREVLEEYDIDLGSFDVARLAGFDIAIAPFATLVPDDEHCVYGIVTRVPATKVRNLYSQDWVCAYQPEAVLVETTDGKQVSALCYIAPPDNTKPTPSDYVSKIVAPAEEYGFPAWYVARLRKSGG